MKSNLGSAEIVHMQNQTDYQPSMKAILTFPDNKRIIISLLKILKDSSRPLQNLVNPSGSQHTAHTWTVSQALTW